MMFFELGCRLSYHVRNSNRDHAAILEWFNLQSSAVRRKLDCVIFLRKIVGERINCRNRLEKFNLHPRFLRIGFRD